jgi:hypothetical protein
MDIVNRFKVKLHWAAYFLFYRLICSTHLWAKRCRLYGLEAAVELWLAAPQISVQVVNWGNSCKTLNALPVVQIVKPARTTKDVLNA